MPRAEEAEHRKGASRGGLALVLVGLAALAAVLVWRNSGSDAPRDASEAGEGEAGEVASEGGPELSNLEAWRAAFLQEIPLSSERDFYVGRWDAPVTLVEFSDFQCPFCRKANGALKEVVSRYPDEVRWVFKNFPLDMTCNPDMAQQLHAAACRTAIVARCAGAEEPALFWKMHDAIFEVEDLGEETLSSVASSLGLTSERFGRCIDTEATRADVEADIGVARELGVSATPTIFLNGRVAPSYDPDDLSEIIDHILSSN